MNHFRFLVAIAVAFVLIALFSTAPVAVAQPKKPTKPVKAPIADAWRIEEPWRPSFAEVLKAKAALADCTPDQLAVVNALRVLANHTETSAKAAPQHRLLTIPELGTGAFATAPELALRLAALLRGGYPATGALTNETLFFLNSSSSVPGGAFSAALLDLLVCDAVCARDDAEFVTLQAKAMARARETCARLEWTSKEPADAPNAEQLRELACEALCRRFAAERQWVSEFAGGWEQVVDSLCERVRPKQALWSEALPDPSDEGASARGLLWLGTLLSLLALEENIDTTKGKLARKYAAAIKSVQRGTEDMCDRPNVRVDLDGASLLMLFATELEPDSLTPVRDHISRQSLNYFTSVDFSSSSLDLAASMGWIADAGYPPAEQAGNYVPSAQLDDRHYVAQLSLTLLGYCSGLGPAGRCTPVGTPADFNIWSNALAVMDAHNTTGLQDKVGNAIDRAAEWLKERQLSDGTFMGDYSSRLGGHCLNMLALLDAGVPREDPCIQKALRVLPALETGQLDGLVYSYAVALLVFQKYYEADQLAAKVLDATEPDAYRKATAKVWRRVKAEHRGLINKMVATLTEDDHGYGWSYIGLATEDGTVADITSNTWRDNSNSQYAVMGLKAASLLGADFDRKVLAAEARRLTRCYLPDSNMAAIRVKLEGEDDKKRTSVDQAASIVPGGWDYTSAKSTPADGSVQPFPASGMTAAGVSSLVICRDELRLHGQLDVTLKADIDLHINGALHWIGAKFGHRYYRGASMPRIYAEGWGKYYDMYSIERAGVLSNVRLMAGVEWYAEGARLLVETQQTDGGWPDIVGKLSTETSPEPDIVDHCFAILFLSRAVVPVTSKPVITQGD